ncbi:MAG: hypothetical protein AAF721_36730 [Myxococcota bacterium]
MKSRAAASASFDARGGVARRTNVRGLARWLDTPGDATQERLEPEAAATESLWLGLRLLTGLSISQFVARFAGVSGAWVRARLAEATRRGDVVWDSPDRVRIAPQRWLMHDAIAAALL